MVKITRFVDHLQDFHSFNFPSRTKTEVFQRRFFEYALGVQPFPKPSFNFQSILLSFHLLQDHIQEDLGDLLLELSNFPL